jgi:hypothetical protein
LAGGCRGSVPRQPSTAAKAALLGCRDGSHGSRTLTVAVAAVTLSVCAIIRQEGFNCTHLSQLRSLTRFNAASCPKSTRLAKSRQKCKGLNPVSRDIARASPVASLLSVRCFVPSQCTKTVYFALRANTNCPPVIWASRPRVGIHHWPSPCPPPNATSSPPQWRPQWNCRVAAGVADFPSCDDRNPWTRLP